MTNLKEVKENNVKLTNSNRINKIKSDIYDIIKEEVDALSPIRKLVFSTIFGRIFDIFSADCNEDELAGALNTIDKMNSKDYVTYDGAMKILCMGNNRSGFKKLMDKYGIKNQSFNNHKIGFKRSDILAVKDKLKEERQKKTLKKR
jgi:hypothetical protein